MLKAFGILAVTALIALPSQSVWATDDVFIDEGSDFGDVPPDDGDSASSPAPSEKDAFDEPTSDEPPVATKDSSDEMPDTVPLEPESEPESESVAQPEAPPAKREAKKAKKTAAKPAKTRKAVAHKGKEGFRRLKGDCEMRREPASDSPVLIMVKGDRKLWVEDVDSEWVKGFRKTGHGYMSRECFR